MKALTGQVLGAAIEVHRALGPGLLEKAYHLCLARELSLRGLAVHTEVPVSVHYKGIEVPGAYRVDLLVERAVVVEVKSVEQVLALHRAQVLTYLRLTGCELGLLLNFNAPTMPDGITRVIRSKTAHARGPLPSRSADPDR